jgi:hypothetical protein
MTRSEISTTERPRFYFVNEVAKELRRSEAAVRYLIATNQLKAGKVGGRKVVRPEDLDAFIEAGFGGEAA